MKPILCLALISTALLLACESDTTRPMEQAHAPTIKLLTQRENVLNNLEVSYNLRRLSPYQQLLDPQFTFFFSPADVADGTTPEQWGYQEETTAVDRLFNRDPNYPTCLSIRMDFKFEEGVQWIEFIPENYPDETWYTSTVEYDFTFELEPDIAFIEAPGSRSQFTVRNIGTDAAPQWRLVEWRDLGAPDSVLLPAMSVKPTTVGAIKSLYR